MFLQISNIDSLTNISSSGEKAQLLLFSFFIIIGIVLIWLIIKGSKTKKSKERNKKRENPISYEKKNNITDISPASKNTEYKSKNVIAIGKQLIKNSEQEFTPLEIIETEQIKHIGYKPTKKFEQKAPFSYPYVIMPEPDCIIKYPQKGRTMQKGFTEMKFKKNLESYFKNPFQLSDNDFVLIKEGYRPYEPDFTLINERDRINIFLDIEIDEPYEGLNEIANRKLTHYQDCDSIRDTALKTRGWITIRFAELQIHQEPLECCLFISEVLKEIIPNYKIHDELIKVNKVSPIRQWSKEEAENMSKENYREKYLGIENFNKRSEIINTPLKIKETDSGKLIEEQINENFKNESLLQDVVSLKNSNSEIDLFKAKINDYLAFTYEEKETIVSFREINRGILKAVCLVETTMRYFDILKIKNLRKKPFRYYKSTGGFGDFDIIRNIISQSNSNINPSDYIRFYYIATWSWSLKDFTTEDIEMKKKCIEDVSNYWGITIKVEQLSPTSPDQKLISQLKLNKNFLCAYCYRRKEMRIFYFKKMVGNWEVF